MRSLGRLPRESVRVRDHDANLMAADKKPSKGLEKTPPERREAALLARVLEILEAARGHAARSVNTTMVHAYWMIGREIVEVEQAGAKRAGYGDEVIDRLAERLVGRRRRREMLGQFGQQRCPNRSAARSGQRRCPDRQRRSPPRSRRTWAGPTISSCSRSPTRPRAPSTRSRQRGKAGRAASWSARWRRSCSSVWRGAVTRRR